MKKLVFLTLILLSNAAYAISTPGDSSGSMSTPTGFFFKPYVGADYQYTGVNYSGIPGTSRNYGDIFSDSFSGGDVHIGARVHKYFGVEASYFDTASSSKSGLLGTTASSSAKFDGWSVDTMGYFPVASKFELIGTAGYARIDAKGSVTVGGTTYSSGGWDNAVRIGGGAQYWLTDNINVRGLLRYESIDSSVIDNAVIADLGLNWQF